MVKLEEKEFVSRLNAALLDRTGESGWVNTLAGSLDMIISTLAGPTKQSTVKPPVIAGAVGYRQTFCVPAEVSILTSCEDCRSQFLLFQALLIRTQLLIRRILSIWPVRLGIRISSQTSYEERYLEKQHKFLLNKSSSNGLPDLKGSCHSYREGM
jgi:hypothetical protein